MFYAYGLMFVTLRARRTSTTTFWVGVEEIAGALWTEDTASVCPTALVLEPCVGDGQLTADLAAVAGHSTKMLLDTYAKPTGRMQMPCWSLNAFWISKISKKAIADDCCLFLSSQEAAEESLLLLIFLKEQILSPFAELIINSSLVSSLIQKDALGSVGMLESLY